MRRIFFLQTTPGLPFPESRDYFCQVEWPDWRCAEDYIELINPAPGSSPLLKSLLEELEGYCDTRHLTVHARQRVSAYARERYIDRLIAWEFLRRNIDYQRAWAKWSLARDRDNNLDTEETSRLRAAELLSISARFGVCTDFDKSPDPFRGGLPRFSIEGKVIFPRPEELSPAAQAESTITVQIRLDRPLAPQLADLELLALRKAPKKITPPFRRRPANYAAYLRVLDAIADGAPRSEAAAIIFPGVGGAKRFDHALKAARKITQAGYLDLIRRHVAV